MVFNYLALKILGGKERGLLDFRGREGQNILLLASVGEFSYSEIFCRQNRIDSCNTLHESKYHSAVPTARVFFLFFFRIHPNYI